MESGPDERIIVALSKEDLRDFDITYEEIDYKNIETRRVIWTILDEARTTLGTAIDPDGRLLIEVAPAENGGCVLCFTSLPENEGSSKKKLIMKKDNEPLLLEAQNEDAFLDAYFFLQGETDKLREIQLYRYEEHLFVVVTPMPMKAQYLSFRLSEYGEVYLGERELLSEILEYGSNLKKASAT